MIYRGLSPLPYPTVKFLTLVCRLLVSQTPSLVSGHAEFNRATGTDRVGESAVRSNQASVLDQASKALGFTSAYNTTVFLVSITNTTTTSMVGLNPMVLVLAPKPSGSAGCSTPSVVCRLVPFVQIQNRGVFFLRDWAGIKWVCTTGAARCYAGPPRPMGYRHQNWGLAMSGSEQHYSGWHRPHPDQS